MTRARLLLLAGVLVGCSIGFGAIGSVRAAIVVAGLAAAITLTVVRTLVLEARR